MAVSAVYLKVAPISRGDGKLTLDTPVVFSNISSTTAAFTLSGGKYTVEAQGATFGTITLQVLSIDGSTYLTAATAFSANGIVTLDLPAGSYRFALA